MITDPGHVDKISGQTTTGHEWDGIRELNTPLPLWWLYMFYLTIVFAFGYWIVYPSWPLVSSYAPGLFGYTNRTQVAADVAAGQAARMQMAAGLEKASLAQIVGYPNLTAGRWLWGGTLDQIQTTITHGIRADDPDTHTSLMPSFGKDEILKPEQVREVVSYVRTLSGLDPEQGVDVAAGKKIFAENCVACHGEDGKGNTDMGSANLTTKVWQYGSDLKDLTFTIAYARNSTMPAWGQRLDPETIKALAVYVHSLGGGT